MKPAVNISVALLLLLGCTTTKDIVRTSENTPPSIRFTFDKVAVPIGQIQVLTVNARDADGDTLYVVWKKTGGTFNDLDQGKMSMRWKAPATLEVDTIEAMVTDGKATNSARLILKTGTPVLSDISGAKVWNLSGSPYIVSPGSDILTISQGAVLTVDAGVEVYIDKQDCSLSVEGELRVNGQPSSPVVIKPNRRSPSAGSWGGIQVITQILPGGNPGVAGKLHLNYLHISHGINNIVAENNADAFMTGCRVTNASAEGILFRSTGALIVRDSEVSNNRGDGVGIVKYSGIPDSILVADSRILFNQGSGISITVRDTTGIAPVEITGDSIVFNGVHGINIAVSAYPLIRNNAIFLNDLYRTNGGYAIHVSPGFNGPKDTIDARCNYWGYAYAPGDSGKISDFIYDGNDNGSINARVRFVPWMDSYPGSCTP